MNRIVERIKKENISLEKHYGETNQYTYHGGKNLITYPAFDDLNDPQTIFILAHEFGHHYQQRYGFIFHLVSHLSRMKHHVSLLFFPFLIWEEIDAWLYAWRICKKEKVSRKGFLEVSMKALVTYFRSFLSQIIGLGKYVLGFYIGTVFSVRFLIISEEMKLQQPEWLQSVRQALATSTTSHNEIISSIFSVGLTTWVIYLVVYLAIIITMKTAKLN